MKKIFVIDWLMAAAFLPTLCSGFGLHIAGHGTDHGIWHNWALFHVLSSILFLILTVFHIKTHSGWYKSLFHSGIGRKSKVTALLSCIFAIVTFTGIALLCINGPNTKVGLWHYRIGIITAIISIGHIIKRFPILRKTLKK